MDSGLSAKCMLLCHVDFPWGGPNDNIDSLIDQLSDINQ